MALNYSHRPMFPVHICEDNLFSPMRNVSACLAEGVSEPIGQDYARPCNMSQGGETEVSYFNCRSDRVHHRRSPESESHSEDVVDRLPDDPFRMGVQNTFTALTGWLEDLGVDYGGFMGGNNGIDAREDYSLFAECNLVWKNSFMFQPFPGNFRFCDDINVGIRSFPSHSQVYEKHVESDMGSTSALYDLGFQPACTEEGIMEFNNRSSELHFGEKVEVAADSEGVPHEALAFALSHLGVKDLLTVERVCRSLCSAVRGDPLLWMSINIEQPLNEKITDDLLLQLACRAQGSLKCLSLVRCPRVTDNGIRRILESNTRLTKLFVPGSTRLTIEGILSNIKTHNSGKGVAGIKHLRIGGISGVTREYFEELELLLGSSRDKLKSHHMPHFYHRGDLYLPYDDDRALDIEICPKCENYRLVYDCPSEGCQGKDKASPICRGCTLCIPRCAQCGRCINDNEYEETFCLDWLCLDCFEQPPSYRKRLEKKVDSRGTLHEPSLELS